MHAARGSRTACPFYVSDERPVSRVRISGRRAGQRFDADHGVVTEALLFLGDLDPEAIGPAIEHATHYEPTPVGEMLRLLAHVPFDVARATFVDLGSGMGRAVFEAASLPFRQAVGIEISPALHAIARDNLAVFDRGGLRCTDLRFVRGNAVDARLPRGDLVAYLFNPFDAAFVARVVERLAAHAGDVALVYHTPVERDAVEASPAFELAGEEPYGAVYRKISAAARKTADPSRTR